MANFLKHIAALCCCVTGFALLILKIESVGAAPLSSTAAVNSIFPIPLSDYELQTSLIGILLSPHSIFKLMFGNLPGQSNPHTLGILHIASNRLVWFTYRGNNPSLYYDTFGGTSTSLYLQPNGDLVISVHINGVDVLLWHTSTLNKGVRSMQLTDNGNLVLLDSSQSIVWQSFDYPVDTLLSTQKLLVGKSLVNAARNKYPFRGWNSLAMEAHRLVSYVNYDDPEPYWELKAANSATDFAYAAIANASISIFDKDGKLLASRGNANSSGEGSPILQILFLDDDGNIRLYHYDNSSAQWLVQMQVIVEACALPDDCGFYGLCIPGQGCRCPPNFKHLATVDGCVPPRHLVCNSRHGSDFVRIPAASYFATNISTGTITDISLKQCQDKCTSNCSCLGFFYGVEKGSTVRGNCLITNQMRTFSASVYGNYTDKYKYDAYVRVQGQPRSPLPIILGVCIPVVVIIACLILWWFIRHQVKAAHTEEEEFLLGALPGLLPRYSYRELKIATNNFSNKIGGGSFGSVYEGVLGADKTKIAVKQLEGIVQGKKEFHAKVATIGTVRHLNLVRLRGFCLEGNHRLLVYEHMGRGSLDALLFPKENSQFRRPSWAERLTIAIGVAKGLAYLHEGCPDCIIHCDIKPENILVGSDGVAKLSDFGLAKLKSRERAFVETNVRGTRGYMAPEWLKSHGQITEKADVYSYGVMLLELLSRRRNFEAKAGSSLGYLPEWALRNLASGREGDAEAILDDQIVAEMDPAGRNTVMVALWCLQEEPAMRPNMGHVVRMLEGNMEVPPPPPPPPPPSSDTSSPLQLSPRALEMDRFANSEIIMPWFHRASHFLFSSSAPQTVSSSIY